MIVYCRNKAEPRGRLSAYFDPVTGVGSCIRPRDPVTSDETHVSRLTFGHHERGGHLGDEQQSRNGDGDGTASHCSSVNRRVCVRACVDASWTGAGTGLLDRRRRNGTIDRSGSRRYSTAGPGRENGRRGGARRRGSPPGRGVYVVWTRNRRPRGHGTCSHTHARDLFAPMINRSARVR